MSMSLLLTHLFLLLLLLLHPKTLADKGDEEQQEFITNCPPYQCGNLSIRYPFCLSSSHPSCGTMALSCSPSSQTLLALSSSNFTVTAIDYRSGVLTIKLPESWGDCLLRNLSSVPLLSSPTYTISFSNISFLGCSNKFTQDLLFGPVSCLGDAHTLVYVAADEEEMGVLPPDCFMISSGGQMPTVWYYGHDSFGEWVHESFGEMVADFAERREVRLSWSDAGFCRGCEEEGNRCGFVAKRNQTICLRRILGRRIKHGSHVKLIVGTSVGGSVVLSTLSLILFYISRKSQKEKLTRMKVEKFLATYKAAKPTRYTYSGIKKITKRFRQKLGQGGFGVVYKGELPNGIPIAVKMLEKSKGEGEEFINEVATIGRIHHVNVVRLLGFCSEGTRHALIYEFMPNESLEKFIFSKEAKRSQPLSMEKLEEIAIGIARGIEYLHQGCDQRILHFDIKPHNILLDHDLNPKISDFGLAKLCSRDQSIITMTAARGTLGYIAPEIYSRNFGTVSYKSDVYSFGMLLLEMVSGKKNGDPMNEGLSGVYFPEWVYERLAHGEDLGLATDKSVKEVDVVRKLVTVALWCIQLSPADRPSMTRVVQMLTGNTESLEMPPKPFVSSTDQDNSTTIQME